MLLQLPSHLSCFAAEYTSFWSYVRAVYTGASDIVTIATQQATMVLQVYLDPCTINSRKVLAGLDLVGTKFDLHHIDFFKGGQKDPEFAKINPCCTVPAAVDGDLILTESNAILQYAADEAGSKAYPVDRKQRAEVNRWLFWESSVWFQTCKLSRLLLVRLIMLTTMFCDGQAMFTSSRMSSRNYWVASLTRAFCLLRSRTGTSWLASWRCA